MLFYWFKRPWALAAAMCSLTLSGCAVVAVASTAISVTASVVELGADAAVGTARIVGKGVGKAADAWLDEPATPTADGTLVATPAAAVTADALHCGSVATDLLSDSLRQPCTQASPIAQP